VWYVISGEEVRDMSTRRLVLVKIQKVRLVALSGELGNEQALLEALLLLILLILILILLLWSYSPFVGP
jgi:hypothetical protein